MLIRFFGGTGQQYEWFSAANGLKDLRAYDEASKMDNMPSKRGKHRMLVLKAMDLADERLADVREEKMKAKEEKSTKKFAAETPAPAPPVAGGRTKRTTAKPQRFRETEQKSKSGLKKKEKKAVKVEWTQEEDTRLERLVGRGKNVDWVKIAKQMKTNRTPKASHTRWFTVVKPKRRKKKRKRKDVVAISTAAAATGGDSDSPGSKISPTTKRRQMPLGLSLSVEEKMKWSETRSAPTVSSAADEPFKMQPFHGLELNELIFTFKDLGWSWPTAAIPMQKATCLVI